MRTETEKNRIILYLEGRIDSANASDLKRELAAVLARNPDLEPVLDAGELRYISSAGLRVLLNLTRERGRPVPLLNVSPEVYEILEMTGFTSLLQVKKKMRRISVDGCRIIGRGAVGTVYRIDDDTIVKVYEAPDSLPMIENEQKRAKQALLRGIPTAISYDVVRVGEKYGSVFELVRAETYNDLIMKEPDRMEEIVRDYARFLRGVHAVEMPRDELPDARNVFLGYLDQLSGALPGELAERLRGLFLGMRENLHVVHGDIQMKNVMLSGEETLLIDMDTLSVGDPVFDLMSAYVAYIQFNEDDPGNSDVFLGLKKETCDSIWANLLRFYFEGRGEETVRQAEIRIRIVACVRFLHLLLVQKLGDPALHQVRTEHTLAHLRTLLPLTDSLEIGTL